MSQSHILTLAQQGDCRAISLLINQVLRPKGVTATVNINGQLLSILLESEKLPLETACTQLIENGLKRLGLKAIELVIIYGRRIYEKSPAWQQVIRLNNNFKVSTILSPQVDVEINKIQENQPIRLNMNVEINKHPENQPMRSNIDANTTNPVPILWQVDNYTAISSPRDNFIANSVVNSPQIALEAVSDSGSGTMAVPSKNLFLMITALSLLTGAIASLIFTYPKYAHLGQLMSDRIAYLLSLSPSDNRPSNASTPTIKPTIKPTINQNIVKPNIARTVTSQPLVNPTQPDVKWNISNQLKTLSAKPIIKSHISVSENQPQKIRLGATKPTQNKPVTNQPEVIKQITNLAGVLVQNPAYPETTISIKAVGDIIPGTNFPDYRLPSNPDYLFSNVLPLLEGADLLFGNFESTLTDYPYSAKDTSRGMVFAFRTPPSYKDILKTAGFDVLSVANNHSYDFNLEGFMDTIAHINSTGMQAIGKRGQIVYEEVKGVKIAFIAFSNYSDVHNSVLELEASAKIVQEADENADIVVLSFHAGAEGSDAVHVRDQTEYFFSENRGNLVQFSRRMIDAGADLVLGHGPHVPRALELYQGKLIAYSLGNFLGYRTLSTEGVLGYSLVLLANLNPEGDFVSGQIIPVILDNRGIPYPDDRGLSIDLIRYLTKNDFPNTPLEIDANGEILLKN